MFALLKRLLLISLLTAMPCIVFQYACAYESANKTVRILPKKSDSGNTKPEIPSLIQLSASIDRDLITITSSENVTARITITDCAEEEYYFDCIASLSPTYSFYFYPPDITEELTLHVIIGDKEYIGYLEPEW